MISRHALAQRLFDEERGSVTVWVVMIFSTLMVLIGLVVDSAGAYEADANATQIAQSAARAAADQISGDVVLQGDPTLASSAATSTAESYLAASNMNGTVQIANGVITVHATATYSTKVISIIGLPKLVVSGTAAATLITNG